MVQYWKDKAETAEETVISLRKALDLDKHVPKLSPMENKIAFFLRKASPRIVHPDKIIDIVSSNQSTASTPGSLTVNICRIRSKLKRHGIGITNVHGWGYYMDQESAKNWDKLID